MPPPLPPPVPHLDAPFTRTTLLQIRTSKMKPMHNLTITTGIYKQPRHGRIFCSFAGLDSDEHDLTFHGGTEKAVHQYYTGHYETWKKENPDEAGNFEVGAFGENLVTGLLEGGNGVLEAEMNERNVCIGDIISVGKTRNDGGDGVLLQVCLPRQPCFKLNHRFGIKGFLEQTWKKSRTGWYYRVLEEGWMEVGDEVVLVERKYPKWTIERLQEFLNRNMGNREMLEELDTIEEFGGEAKKRITSLLGRLNQPKMEKVKETWEEWDVVEKVTQTKRITSFVIKKEGAGGKNNPGCFVRLKLPNGLIRSYSIVSGDTHTIELGIALEDQSRGGSRYLHQSVQAGSKILVGKITEGVPVKDEASNHIFIAGGIGITAFLDHCEFYDKINFNYEFHYAVRSGEDIPFKERLEKLGDRLRIYDAAKGERMDISQILSKRKWNSFVYVCGPQRMIDQVVRQSTACGMAQDEIHYEAFQIEKEGDPFEFVVGKGKVGKVLQVAAGKSLLEILREAGFEVESSCETGNCGTCKVKVCDGRVEHRGSGLMEEEKEGQMLSCVSRGIGRIVIDF